jgi:hypothetical protein
MRERDNVINLRLFWGGGREPYVLPSNKGEIRWMDANLYIRHLQVIIDIHGCRKHIKESLYKNQKNK